MFSIAIIETDHNVGFIIPMALPTFAPSKKAILIMNKVTILWATIALVVLLAILFRAWEKIRDLKKGLTDELYEQAYSLNHNIE